MTVWTNNTVASSTWVETNLDYYNTWGDWSATTWDSIQGNSLTWVFMQGETFVEDPLLIYNPITDESGNIILDSSGRVLVDYTTTRTATVWTTI